MRISPIRSLKASLALVVAALALAASPSARADFDHIVTSGHVDAFAVSRTATGLSMSIHAEDEDTGDEFTLDPATTLLIAGPNTLTTRPAGSRFDFIGVAPGESFYKLSSESIDDQLFLGASAEDVPTNSILSYLETDPRVNRSGRFIKISLVNVSGAGHFSMWTGNGPDSVWMSSFDGISASDAIFVPARAHQHYNWGFSAEGLYAVTVRATAFAADGSAISSLDTTYNFYAGDYNPSAAVPEPASLAMLAMGGSGLAWMGRRRKKVAADA